ncbi:unnamed protein product, partial [Mesorhabditis spiculigera]
MCQAVLDPKNPSCPTGLTCYLHNKTNGCYGPPPKPCEDADENCANWVKNGFCTDPYYAKSKADYCAKSCGLCYDTCADKSASCKNWKANGFCENALYDSIKKDYCSATCGLC